MALATTSRLLERMALLQGPAVEPVRMAGLRKGPRAPSTRSLGSFVDIQSASSSDFEPVDLEDMESADEGEPKTSGLNPAAGAYSL